MSNDEDQQFPLHVPDNFADAERFKRLFVDPAVQAMSTQVKLELQPIVAGQRKLFAAMNEQAKKDIDQDARITKMEGKQTKALLGWGVYATGAAALIGIGLDWLKKKLHWT